MKNLLIILLIASALTSCRKVQPDMPEPDDLCDCLLEKRSTFFMGEKFLEENVDLDTVIMPIGFYDGNPANFDYFTPLKIYFSANYDDALSYEWQVGFNPTSQSTKEFDLLFNDTMQINVRLIMTSIPNTKCFPNDDGIDTIERTLTIRHELPHPMWGSYYGYSDENPSEYFTIEIDTLTRYYAWTNPNYSCKEVIKNLPNGKINPIIFGRSLGSSSYSFIGVWDGYAPYSDIIYVDNLDGAPWNSSRGFYDRHKKEIRIIYYTREIISPFQLGNVFTKHEFIGQKL